MECWINIGGMMDENFYRLYVSSNMFHPTCKPRHSFIRRQNKDGDRKRRHQLGSFHSIIKELTVDDRCAFKEMFRKSVEDFETVLKHIDNLISPQEIEGGHGPVLSD